jgi:hypothetical protein
MSNELYLSIEFRIVGYQDQLIDSVQPEGNCVKWLSCRNVNAELHASLILISNPLQSREFREFGGFGESREARASGKLEHLETHCI